MTSAGRREALEVLTRRGLSQRKACRYLELSRRVAGYQLLQPEKDRSLTQLLIAASQEVPRFAIGVCLPGWPWASPECDGSGARSNWAVHESGLAGVDAATTFGYLEQPSPIRSGATTLVMTRWWMDAH